MLVNDKANAAPKNPLVTVAAVFPFEAPLSSRGTVDSQLAAVVEAAEVEEVAVAAAVEEATPWVTPLADTYGPSLFVPSPLMTAWI